MARRMPKGFRIGHQGDLACPHRDITCCESCIANNPEIVDVLGAAYWISDPVEREAFKAEVREPTTGKKLRTFMGCG